MVNYTTLHIDVVAASFAHPASSTYLFCWISFQADRMTPSCPWMPLVAFVLSAGAWRCVGTSGKRSHWPHLAPQKACKPGTNSINSLHMYQESTKLLNHQNESSTTHGDLKGDYIIIIMGDLYCVCVYIYTCIYDYIYDYIYIILSQWHLAGHLLCCCNQRVASCAGKLSPLGTLATYL